MTESIFERPLTIDEVKKVGAFYVEIRSKGLRTYLTHSPRLIRYIDDEAVHLIGKNYPYFEIAEFGNYNIGWRAWISCVSDKMREAHSWDEVKNVRESDTTGNTMWINFLRKGA